MDGKSGREKKRLRSDAWNYRFKEYVSIQSESRSVPSLTETSPNSSSLVHATIFISLPFHLIISIPCLVPGLFSPFPPILRTADFQQPPHQYHLNHFLAHDYFALLRECPLLDHWISLKILSSHLWRFFNRSSPQFSTMIKRVKHIFILTNGTRWFNVYYLLFFFNKRY